MNAVSEQELEAHQKKQGGKRVTEQGLEANIKKIDVIVHEGTCLTIAIITLLNGYTVTGESACADPAMFNAEIGQRIAIDNAKKKIWPLMGYALRQELFLSENAGGDFQSRVRQEEAELTDKLVKLQAFVEGNVQFDRLDAEDQTLLTQQLFVMTEYQQVLRSRIARFG